MKSIWDNEYGNLEEDKELEPWKGLQGSWNISGVPARPNTKRTWGLLSHWVSSSVSVAFGHSSSGLIIEGCWFLSRRPALQEAASSPEPLSFCSLLERQSDLHVDPWPDYFSFLDGPLICDPLEFQRRPFASSGLEFPWTREYGWVRKGIVSALEEVCVRFRGLGCEVRIEFKFGLVSWSIKWR